MMQTKLILIEGLPGSGKTTLAEFLSAQLERHGISAQCYYEETLPHPLHAPWDDKPESFAAASVGVWQSFGHRAKALNLVTILESALFQSGVRLLMQQNLNDEKIKLYVEHIEATITELNPVLIYFQQANVEHAINRICKLRGASWQSYFVKAVTDNLYGHQRELQGFVGAITFMKSYNALCNELYRQLTIKKMVIDNCNTDWYRCYEEIMNFLGLALD